MSFPRDFADDRKFFARVNRGQPRRKPLRTVTELAEEFGLTQRQLSALMRWSELNPPRMEMKAGQNTYFDPQAVREWWARHLAAQQDARAKPAPRASDGPQGTERAPGAGVVAGGAENALEGRKC